MDIKKAFLNGGLNEEVYMEQPEGFVINGLENKVYKLAKSLYDLKQAHKQWHEKIDKVIFSNEFKINKVDKCVYMKNTDKGYISVCLYVDDILILGSNDHIIMFTKKMLINKFDMKDLNVVNVIPGIQISKTSNGFVLS